MEHFKYFKKNIESYELPDKFTYPFHYDPHPLCQMAAQQLQKELYKLSHNFGLIPQGQKLDTIQIGKMFGVLVVQKADGIIGYLSAVSGKLQSPPPPNLFVPSISNFDQAEDSKKIQKVKLLNNKINNLYKDSYYLSLLADLKSQEEKIESFRKEMIIAKSKRKEKRKSSSYIEHLHEQELIRESLSLKYERSCLKEIQSELKQKLDIFLGQVRTFENQRKKILVERQIEQLNSYVFKNIDKKELSLKNIFQEINYKPPAGTGDCSAPRLLNYAFENNLKPIAMAEFWWGVPHKSMIKKHKAFYPSCTSRCKPILSHMLKGLSTLENPMLTNTGQNKKMEFIFEDNDILIVNKPDGLLSVPGINIKDSVLVRIQKRYPKLSGPFIIHRLDQETSGIMIIGKSENICKAIQKQFINRTIKKRYIALLETSILPNLGEINLPLALDFNNRPRQMVSQNNGKPAITKFEVINKKNGKTLIYLYPKTGRTHQLRVHCAYYEGLNSPIVGDTLYGKKDKRLCLHAEYIKFTHPRTKEHLEFQSRHNF